MKIKYPRKADFIPIFALVTRQFRALGEIKKEILSQISLLWNEMVEVHFKQHFKTEESMAREQHIFSYSPRMFCLAHLDPRLFWNRPNTSKMAPKPSENRDISTI